MSENNSSEDSLYTKLSSDIDNTKWDLLAPHHERNAAFYITPDVELIAVAMAMARDESQYVKEWINQGKLLPPTQDQIKQWSEEGTDFKYIIIQPYVIFQNAHPDVH